MSEETSLGVAAPAESFNFARHLIDLNTSRDAKLAYIDDGGACTYAELFRRVTRFADALIQLGLHREERLLLLAPTTRIGPWRFWAPSTPGLSRTHQYTLLGFRYRLRPGS
jgi:benzoate-CoA ligase